MTPQRQGELTDEELAEVVTSLVLMPKGTENVWKTLEYLILRRISGLSVLDLSKVTQAYAHLMS